MTKCGVLLVNTGTPEAPEPHAVKKYLSKFLMDPRIRPMNRLAWGLILHLSILPKRAPVSARKYASIWTPEGSPLKATCESLAAGLEAHYRQVGVDAKVLSAMNYSEPSVARSVRELSRAGCEELVVLPLYPQSAFSTTGSVADSVKRATWRARWRGPVAVVDNYHEDAAYVRAVAASVRHAGFNADPDSDDRLLFSFHSIPLADIEAGDTYELQSGATSLAVASELGLDRRRWSIAYQCRFDKDRSWLAPFTHQTLSSWAQSDSHARVFVVCPNFAVDCLETLYDVERELMPEYLEARVKAGYRLRPAGDDFVYVPCLNKSRAHVRVLAHVLEPYVQGGAR